MNTTTTSRRSITARVLGVTALAVLAVGLSACSSGSAAATSTSASPSTVVTTSTADVTKTTDVTQTDVVTSAADVTRTDRTTATQNNGGTGGGDNSSSTPPSCPDPATLGAVTPNYDPKYPISSINCASEWAVGSYEADGKNQTTAIWRNTSGSWVFQDRAAICAVADNLPPELYQQACTGS